MATKFKDFMGEIEKEALLGGAKAVKQLDNMKRFFREKRKELQKFLLNVKKGN